MKPQRLVFSLILSIAYLFSSTAALNSAFAASSETDPPETSTDPCSTPNSQDPRCVLDPMVVTATRAPKDESNSMSEAEVLRFTPPSLRHWKRKREYTRSVKANPATLNTKPAKQHAKQKLKPI